MAATNINVVVLTGNLTRDPELRSLPSGMSVCSLRIASNTRRKGQSGEWEDKANYFDVTVWGAQGENCARFLSKGRPVALNGRLEWREWQAPGRHEAPERRDHRRLRAVPRRSRRGPGRRRQRLHAAVRRPGQQQRLPARRRARRRRRRGRRHPLLGRVRTRSGGPRGRRPLRVCHNGTARAPRAAASCAPRAPRDTQHTKGL